MFVNGRPCRPLEIIVWEFSGKGRIKNPEFNNKVTSIEAIKLILDEIDLDFTSDESAQFEESNSIQSKGISQK